MLTTAPVQLPHPLRDLIAQAPKLPIPNQHLWSKMTKVSKSHTDHKTVSSNQNMMQSPSHHTQSGNPPIDKPSTKLPKFPHQGRKTASSPLPKHHCPIPPTPAMPAIRGPRSKRKTRRRTRDTDQIHTDLHDPTHLRQHKQSRDALDLPGLGEWYCAECARWFEGEGALARHRRGKVHKRR